MFGRILKRKNRIWLCSAVQYNYRHVARIGRGRVRELVARWHSLMCREFVNYDEYAVAATRAAEVSRGLGDGLILLALLDSIPSDCAVPEGAVRTVFRLPEVAERHSVGVVQPYLPHHELFGAGLQQFTAAG